MNVNRREFVKTGVAAAAATSLTAKALGKPKAKTGKPNILYLFSDQHRAASLPGEAFNQALAPNIDAFRQANFSMDTCITNYPLCTPYRAILQTGRYSCQTGMVTNGVQLKTSEVTIAQTFAGQGYRTGYVGKWHLGHDDTFTPPGPERHGYEDWHIWAKTNNHYGSITFDPVTGKELQPSGWSASRMTDQAVDLLRQQTPDKPWLLMVSWNPPHPPFNPPPNDQAPYAGTMKKRPNVEITGRGPGPLHTEEKWHEAIQGYYGGITGIDLEFARMLKTLDEIGQADNTIVVYTADHGEMMGSQGRMSKQVPYEESCRVPFSVRYPGVTKNGSSSDMLFAAIDIFPTLCGLAGVAAPKTCVGRDHSTVMRGGKMEPSEMVFLMNGGANELAGRKAKGRKGGAALPGNEAEGDIEGKAPAYRGLRTKTHTYAVDTAGRWMLHDNVADPYQMKNLANDPSQKALMESFDVALLQWMKMTGDPFQWPKLT